MTGGEGGGWAAAVLGFVEGWFWIADPGLRRGDDERAITARFADGTGAS